MLNRKEALILPSRRVGLKMEGLVGRPSCEEITVSTDVPAVGSHRDMLDMQLGVTGTASGKRGVSPRICRMGRAEKPQ